MVREFSAGGVVVRRMQGAWRIAVIEPQVSRSSSALQRKGEVLALPKGNVDKGEKPEQTALREVREETGIEAEMVAKLHDIKYFYIRSWAGGERVFKVVSFYLMLYRSGRIGRISEDMRREVRHASWLPFEEALKRLSYRGEREVVKLARQYLEAHLEI
ncbi:MAG: NUDIX hydrolase [Terriglobales bacterium]